MPGIQRNPSLPDVKDMLAVETRVIKIYHSETTRLLPAVRERLQTVADGIQNANDKFRAQVTQSLVTLNLDLEGFNQQTAAELDEHELVNTRSELQAEIAQVIEHFETFRRISVPELAGLQQGAQADWAQGDTALKQIQQTIKSQEDNLAEIDSSLAALKAPSVSQALRNMIPEEQDIDTVVSQIKNPSLSPDLIKAALAKLNKNLDLLAQGRDFANVLKARDRIAADLEREKQNLRALEKQLQQKNETIDQYQRAQELLGLRQQWLGQAALFTQGWSSTDNTLRNSHEGTRLLAALGQARDYLLAVRRAFEAV